MSTPTSATLLLNITLTIKSDFAWLRTRSLLGSRSDLLSALSGFAFILFLVMLLVRRLVKTLPHSKETLVAYQVVSTQKLIVDTTLPVSTLHHIAEVRRVNIGEQWQEVLYS